MSNLFVSKKTKSDDDFSYHIDKGIQWALARIKMNFEHSPNAHFHLPYHDSKHTQFVIDKVGLILSSIRNVDPKLVTQRDIEIGKFAAAFHDVFIRWEKKVVPDGEHTKVLRKRLIPDSIENEKASAEIAIKYMDIVNEVQDFEIFNSDDKEIVRESIERESIEITIPSYDPVTKTVKQPRLTLDSSIVARSVAMADIGAAGMDVNVYTDGGDRLFREENIDIYDAINLNPSEVSGDKEEYYRNRMIYWSEFQIGFAQGRKVLSHAELMQLPSKTKDKIIKLFENFDNSIHVSQKMFEKRGKMSFSDLIADMGYI
jgi:hypothetical protein